MPLDVLGRTRATLTHTTSISGPERRLVISNMRRDGDRSLEFLILNEECLVSVSHQLALIKSLPFVHTARRSYRFEWSGEPFGPRYPRGVLESPAIHIT